MRPREVSIQYVMAALIFLLPVMTEYAESLSEPETRENMYTASNLALSNGGRCERGSPESDIGAGGFDDREGLNIICWGM